MTMKKWVNSHPRVDGQYWDHYSFNIIQSCTPEKCVFRGSRAHEGRKTTKISLLCLQMIGMEWGFLVLVLCCCVRRYVLHHLHNSTSQCLQGRSSSCLPACLDWCYIVVRIKWWESFFFELLRIFINLLIQERERDGICYPIVVCGFISHGHGYGRM